VTPCFASAITEYGTTFPLGDGTAGDGTEKSIDFGNIIKKEAIDKESSASERIQQALGVNYSAGEAKEQRATFYIKQLINRFLAIIGLVATVVLIY
jgi:hypothetical protein